MPATREPTAREVFALAARTATPTAATVPTDGAQSFLIVVDVTAIAATPSVVVTVSGLDPVSGKIYTILVSAAITATGTTVLRVSPHLTASANLIAKDIAPPDIRVAPVHGDADSITYSVAILPTA